MQRAANEAGSARQKEIDGALDVMKDWCHTRFLVNACIKDARDLHHEREKEIRSVRLKADEMSRLDRVEQRRARQESQKQNVKQPMKLGGSTESPESRSESRAEEVKTKQSRAESAGPLRRRTSVPTRKAGEGRQKGGGGATIPSG